jgi:ribosome recycling factor
MKNPFKKEDHTGLIVLLGLTAVAAGAVAYLFLTEQGEDTRKSLKKKIKQIAKDAAAKAVSKKTGFSKKTVKKAADAVVK